MATLVNTPKDLVAAFEHRDGESWEAADKRATAKLDELEQVSDALPPGEVTGAVIRFPAADNYARYLVVSAKPLQLAHLPYMDGYHVGAPMIRGLRLVDVQEMVRRNHVLAQMFASRKKEPAHV